MRVMNMRQFRSTDQQFSRWKKIRLPGAMPSDFSSVVRYALDRLYEQLVGPIDVNADLGTTVQLCKKCNQAIPMPGQELCLMCNFSERSGGKIKRGSELPTHDEQLWHGPGPDPRNADLVAARDGDPHKRGFNCMTDEEIREWGEQHGMTLNWVESVLDRLNSEYRGRSGTTPAKPAKKKKFPPANGKKAKAKAAPVAPPAKAKAGAKGARKVSE